MLIILFIVIFFVYIISFNDLFPSLAFLRLGLLLNVIGAGALIFNFFIGSKRLWLRQHTLMLLFWAAVVASRLFNQRLSGSLDALVLFMPCVVLYLLLSEGARQQSDLFRAFRAVALAALLISLASITATHSGSDDTPWVLQQGREELNDFGVREYIARSQALGTLNDPNAFAQFLISVLPIIWFSFGGASIGWRLLRYGSVVSLLYCSFLTRSRGGLVGLAVLSVLSLKRKFGLLFSGLAGGAVFAILVAIGFSGGRSVSLTDGENRMDIWADGLAAFKSSPIWGVGFGLFTEHSLYSAHNAFVECFTELGLAGYCLWIALFVTTYWQLAAVEKFAKQGKLDSWYASASWALMLSLASYTTMSLFLARAFAVPLYVLIGGAASLYSLAVATVPEIVAECPPSRLVKHSLLIVVMSFALLYLLLRLV